MRTATLLSVVFFALGLAAPSFAEVDWEVVRTLPLESKPLDIAVSTDGKRVFVLVEGGKVQVYSPGGKLQETLALKGAVDGIALSPTGDMLYARSGEGKTVQVIRLEFIQPITVGDSPVKGPEGAPVVIAVFTDFQ